jgi:single-strand DNA-binding protein
MSARSLNRVLLIGNLTRDPELRYTPQGTAVATFGLATNRSWSPSDGGPRQEETEYHRIVAWAKLAEICSQLLYKGRKVYVEGRLQTRKWTTQDGMERETTEVVIDNMIALGAPKGGAQAGDEEAFYGDDAPSVAPVAASAQSPAAAPAAPAATDPSDAKKNEDVNIDDIPF